MSRARLPGTLADDRLAASSVSLSRRNPVVEKGYCIIRDAHNNRKRFQGQKVSML